MGKSIGQAYVQIVPSADGIGGKVAQLLNGGDPGKVAGGLIGGNLVGTITKVIAAAGIGKAIGSAISTGMNFDKSMSQVAATMGLTMDEMANEVGTVDLAWGTFSGNLREYAQEMGANTAFSASEAADALNYMALAGYDAQTSMQMLPNVLNLAAAGNMDLARASDMVTDASSALGLTIEDTSVMVDQMAKASSKSNTSVEQLGDAILTVGGTAKMVAGGTNEISTALGIMADSGIKGSEAGTHLRNVLLAMTPKSDKAAEAFDQLSFSAYDAEGNLRPLADIFGELSIKLDDYTAEGKTELLSEMFNKTDLAALDAMLTAAEMDYSELGDAISAAGIPVSDFANALDGQSLSAQEAGELLAKYIRLGYSTEEIADRMNIMYGWSSDATTQALEVVNEKIADQQDRWGELAGEIADCTGAAQAMADTQLDNLAGDVTLFKSALEGVQIAVSDALTPALRGFTQFGSSAMTQISEGIKSGGVAGLGEALGNIVAQALTGLTTQIPNFILLGGQFISGLVRGFSISGPQILTSAQGIITGLTNWINTQLSFVLEAGVHLTEALGQGMSLQEPSLLTTIAGLFAGFGQALLPALPLILNAGATMISNLIMGILQGLPTLLTGGMQVVASLVQGLTTALPSLIAAAGPMLASFLQAFLGALPTIWTAGVQIIVNLVSGLLQGLPQIITAAGQLIMTLMSAIMPMIPQLMTTGLQATVQLVTGLVQGIMTGLPNVLAAIAQIIAQIVLVFVQNFPQIVTTGIQLLGKLITGIINAIPQLPGAIGQVIKNIKEAFSKFDWAKIGADILNGIKDGITGAIDAVVSAAKGAGEAIYNGIKGFFNIGSPSKLMADEVGKWIPEGIAVGITSNIAPVNNAIAGALSAMQSGLQRGISSINPVINATGTERETEREPMNVTVVMEGDMQGLFRQIRTYNNTRTRATGYNALGARS